MYSDIYSFDFRKIEGDDLTRLSPTGNAKDLVWHDDVQIYTVWEATNGTDQSDFVGYLYLDLYYREGKAPGAYMLPLEPGYIKPNGDRHYPTATLATNFRKAVNESETPSLLTSSDVPNLMHELGHCMHHISCRVRYGSQCGPNGAPLDFVEMPSQMMEVRAFASLLHPHCIQHLTKFSSTELLERARGTETTQQALVIPQPRISCDLAEAKSGSSTAF